jgi:3-isopropylmalate/(R)-2-methylmalate dehydratase small subunit
MRITGRAIKLRDNINTDFIISGRYKFAITDIKELAKHIFEDIDPDFPARISPGSSIIVAGKNFGMGSSREQAPLVIKESGIVAVLAKSFARIFYRNAFNIGLPLLETDTGKIRQGDTLELDLGKGLVINKTQRGKSLSSNSVPGFMQDLLHEGGLANYYKKHKTLKI